MIHTDFNLIKVLKCRQDNLWSKRKRGYDRPRRQRAIVRPIRNTPRNVIKENPFDSVNYQILGARTFARRQSPAHLAVAFEAIRIALRVFSLRVSCTTTILEIIQTVFAHELILDPAKIDPDMGELMCVERRGKEIFVIVNFPPLTGRKI